jgi:hypothetical protein
VVVEWSRSRKRYERQGILAEPQAIDRAEEECLEDEDLRARQRMRNALRRDEHDKEFVEEFARRVRLRFPAAPAGAERIIADHACRKYSGRVGRSAAAKRFDDEAIDLAVWAHIRHVHTAYDELLTEGMERHQAREGVWRDVDRVLREWRG